MRKAPLAIALTLSFLGAGTVLGTMDHQKAFTAKYPDAKAKLGKCSTCHTAALPKKDSHESNAFGKDIAAAIGDKKTAIEWDKVWAKVEPMDSDGDGVKNIDEIKAGTNPGVK